VPQHPGVIYMLSAENLVPTSKGVVGAYPPHVMFYGTHLTNADLGVDGADLGPDGNPKGPTFVAGESSPYALIIVPVAAHTSEKRRVARREVTLRARPPLAPRSAPLSLSWRTSPLRSAPPA
jgi:hypothetical protein